MSLTTESRPFTEAERARAFALAHRERPRWGCVALLSVVLVVNAALLTPVVAAAAILVLDGLGLRVDAGGTLRTIGTAAVLILAWVGWLTYASVARRSQRAAEIEMDLADGTVEVLHVETGRAHRLPNDLSHAPVLLHELGDGTALCTRGEHLAPLVDAGLLPCRAFSMVRLPLSQITLDVKAQGERLEATTLQRPVEAFRDGEVVKL